MLLTLENYKTDAAILYFSELAKKNGFNFGRVKSITPDAFSGNLSQSQGFTGCRPTGDGSFTFDFSLTYDNCFWYGSLVACIFYTSLPPASTILSISRELITATGTSKTARLAAKRVNYVGAPAVELTEFGSCDFALNDFLFSQIGARSTDAATTYMINISFNGFKIDLK